MIGVCHVWWWAGMEKRSSVIVRHEHMCRQYYWEQYIGPFFDKKYNSSIGIGIGTFKVAIFAFLLLLLVIKILNIGLYLGNIWYCFDIVQWHTLIPINE